MSRIEEIKRRIEELNKLDFTLQMSDRWSDVDFALHSQYQSELGKLISELEELENTR